MAIKFYSAITDTGGAIGAEIASGAIGALLPTVSSSDRASGITIHRKFYIESDSAIGIDVGIDGAGLFSACMFESAGDAEVVGDLTGSEIKYGSGQIVKLEDSVASTETVNGAGGLIDIKKITVEDDITGDVYFRSGDRVHVDSNIYTILSVASVAEGTEITLNANEVYYGAIGKTAYSNVSTTIGAGLYIPFWLKITVQPSTITSVEYSTFSIATVY